MASLVQKMFDTMPLKGVLGAVATIVGAARPPTLGQVKRFVRMVHSTPPEYTAHPSAPSPGTKPDDAAIWGWHTGVDPSFVTDVTCRVRDMNFAAYVVLERLDFGYAPTNHPKDFRPKVLVVLDGKSIELPLSTECHMTSFVTDGGFIDADENAELWPLKSYQDESLLHVFVYDIDPVTGAVRSLRSPGHPDTMEVNNMLGRLNELDMTYEDDARDASKVLFADNLWNPLPSHAPPTGTVPEHVKLSLQAVRVMVACSLTPCRERDDYQPGKLGGVGRLYPHVMVVATSPLDRVEAGVHFRRPKKTKQPPGEDPHAHHHMLGGDEMLEKIQSLLVADSNVHGMVLHNVPEKKYHGQMVPVPHWANLFNYYVVDPIGDPKVGDNLLPIIRREKTGARGNTGDVRRECSDLGAYEREDVLSSTVNTHRVYKREMQGYFDNLHMAPRMKVAAKIARFQSGHVTGLKTGGPVDQAAWKMDEVAMAPFCAHDCFHMHWRWADNANTEQATWGWSNVLPWKAVGRVMVPENQDVFLQLLGDAEFSYLAQAHAAPKDVWQPFCHHGAGYAVHVGEPMERGRAGISLIDGMSFYDVNDERLDDKGWALFFWRLRYRLMLVGATVVLEERFAFNDESGALDF